VDAGLVKFLLYTREPVTTPAFYSVPAARPCLNLNEHGGNVYFHKESMERVVRLALLREAFRRLGEAGFSGGDWDGLLAGLARTAGLLDGAAGGSGYRLDRFLLYLQSDEFLTLSAGPAPAPPPSQPGS
jgi:hypothetical protein